jgi:hypothetical protein
MCLSLGVGLPEGSQQLARRNLSDGFSSSPLSPGYYAEGLSLSQMRLSQMDGRARYALEYTDRDTTFDPNKPFSLDSTLRGSGAFRFPVDLNSSLDLRRPGSTTGYVTGGTSLSRTLFGDESMSAHQVFGTASSVSMGDDDVSFPSLYVLCAL